MPTSAEADETGAESEDAAAAGIVLASASPRRATLLRQVGIPFRRCPANVQERRRAGESASCFVARVALEKARAVVSPRPVLAADTVVEADGRVLGKPRDEADFHAMLGALSDARHRVLTAVALRWRQREALRVVGAEVSMRRIDDVEMAAYWATGEPRDKAGGYAVQGIGGIFVRDLRGSYSAVVGLPLAETEELLEAFGIDTWGWRRAHRCPKNYSSM